ncbi:hypothetical protein [Alkalibaculum bacchi]|uniref:hypothetical protein n=1 Tax=Alkalibaculum bacchi TaxID=645887 RepID=UPI0026ED67ED|nr:hypothetical protein [Alkalibaculum bacchi]
MKRFIITAIIGSSREEESISKSIAKKFLKKFESNFTEVDIDFKEYSLIGNIQLCTGCMLCFIK